MPELTCFKACDIRCKIGLNIDESIVYNIGRPVAPHLSAKSVVIRFNAHPTSPAFAAAAERGVMDGILYRPSQWRISLEEMDDAIVEGEVESASL